MHFKSYFSAVVIGLTVLTSTNILPTLAQEENTSALIQKNEDTLISPEIEEEGEDEDENAPVFTEDTSDIRQKDPSFSTQNEEGTLLSTPPRIDFTSDDGNGTVNSINWTGPKNFNYSINLRSKNGSRVYVSFKGVRDFAPDTDGHRLTGDTTSRRGYDFKGTKDGGTIELAWSGVSFRVCKRINFRPDKCGDWSRVYRRT